MKTLFAKEAKESRYLFFSKLDIFLSIPTKRSVVSTKTSQRVLNNVIKRTRAEILKHTEEGDLGVFQTKITRVFKAFQKTKKAVTLQIISGLISGEGAEEISKELMPKIFNLCLEKGEAFTIELIIEITNGLLADECKKILTPVIQKLIEHEVLSEGAITGLEKTGEEWQIKNDFIVGISLDGATIAFEFNKKGRISMTPPNLLPRF